MPLIAGLNEVQTAEYAKLLDDLAQGWNTWNTHSVLSHVLLPEGFSINLQVRKVAKNQERYLSDALIGRNSESMGIVEPGPHAYDGSYTELLLKWRGMQLRVQSAAKNGDLVLLVTPVDPGRLDPVLVASCGFLWNRPGMVYSETDRVIAELTDGRKITVFATAPTHMEPNLPTQSPYLAVTLNSTIGFSTGKERSLDEIQEIIEKQKQVLSRRFKVYGDLADVYQAAQTVMAWDTIYDPKNDRVISPVSRIWNQSRGGYVLFCWDTFFAAYMAGIDNKELAYANAVEILREATPAGFVSNHAQGNGRVAYDRSQPPVGGKTVWDLYQKYGDVWLLEETFDALLKWNRWWPQHRDYDGLLCWGSDWYKDPFKDENRGNRQAAAFESGLDNSPMYDDVPFNKETHLLELWDVGLNSLYLMDCDALLQIANVLGRDKAAKELKQRYRRYSANLQRLWDKETGLFLNQRTDTGQSSHRLSPTLFYPLLAKSAMPDQAKRMVEEHLLNPDEFWGEWVLPSSPRNDPAFPEQNYWRGRIWAPLNFLVYLGLQHYDFPQVREELSEKSVNLLLKEWHEHRHVHENYNAVTGEGCDVGNSDRFYHWGALLGVIGLMENGYWRIEETVK